MSLFGAMTTAISGLNAQSRSLGHISDNLANSQTTGFKRIDSNFTDLVTQSSTSSHSPGSVIARPDFTNTVQGTVEQSENPLGLAIGGQGFFSVAQSRGSAGGLPLFDERQFYTRSGDFRMDRDGYLVNGSNYYLQG
jgi:flagellar hook protein FlgE